MKDYWEKAEYAWTDDSVRLISTPSTSARSTFFYIQEIGHFKTYYPFYTEREHLNSYLIVYTLSGNGKLLYGNKTYTVGAGELFFIDCKDYQRYETLKETEWEILWLHINGSTISNYYKQYAVNKSPITNFNSSREVSKLIKRLIQMQQHHGMNVKTEIINSKLIVDLLTKILLNIDDLDVINMNMPGYIEEVKEELDLNYHEKITLNSLAKLVAVNKYQLAKEFKKHTGFTPNEYLITRRINEAKDLLKNTNLPISEISYEVGIDNVSHFINLFKVRVEKTPLLFRQNWQNRNEFTKRN